MVGDWISLSANLDRRRLTVTVEFGELPEGWAWHGRNARSWSALAGLVLIAPFVALLGAAMLRSAGLAGPYEWLAGSTYAILAGTISLFIGIPVAVAMNLWRITHLGLRRERGLVEGQLALEWAPLHLIVVGLALVAGLAFVGHLAVDAFACMNGVRSAC